MCVGKSPAWRGLDAAFPSHFVMDIHIIHTSRYGHAQTMYINTYNILATRSTEGCKTKPSTFKFGKKFSEMRQDSNPGLPRLENLIAGASRRRGGGGAHRLLLFFGGGRHPFIKINSLLD